MEDHGSIRRSVGLNFWVSDDHVCACRPLAVPWTCVKLKFKGTGLRGRCRCVGKTHGRTHPYVRPILDRFNFWVWNVKEPHNLQKEVLIFSGWVKFQEICKNSIRNFDGFRRNYMHFEHFHQNRREKTTHLTETLQNLAKFLVFHFSHRK